MDTQEAAEAYDAMGHGEVDQAFVDRVIQLGGSTGHFLDVGTGPAQIPILLAPRLSGTSTSPPLTYPRRC